MTDKELIAKIIRKVKNASWREIVELGINAQQAQKIREGKPVRFYVKTLERLRKKFEKKGAA